MGPRGGEAPAEAEKETMVEGAAKLAGAPICRKKVSRDRRKTPSMPPAFAAGGCRNLFFFFYTSCRYLFRRRRLVDSSSAPIPHLILLRFQVQPRRQREKSGKTQHKRKQQVLPRCCSRAPPPPPSFFLTLFSHIFRDVSDFDPRKNRQPAPGSTPHVSARAVARRAYAAGASLLPAFEALCIVLCMATVFNNVHKPWP